MQPIKLAFTDTDRFIHPALLKILKAHFNVVIDEDDAQFVVFSIYPGFDFLKHRNAIRIFQSEESIIPDFNLCDFAFGYANMIFDRYMRLPNYFFFDNYHELRTANRSTSRGVAPDRFCNYIYSNLHPHPMRGALFEALNAYRPVHSHGRHLNNAEPIETPTATEGWNDAKLRTQARYKFSIVAENSAVRGYTTEKMTDALFSHTVPIYWGNEEVDLDFNPRRFINVHSFSSLDEVVAEVRRLDSDDDAYSRMLAEPVFTPDNLVRAPTEEKVVAFMGRVFNHSEPVRNQVFWGAWYEERIKGLLDDRENLRHARAETDNLRGRLAAMEADLRCLAELKDRRSVPSSTLKARLAGLSPRRVLRSVLQRVRRKLLEWNG
ncbi:glycosyltransferase family 10 domain-containing protein [Rhodoplanes sp. SY1]|uniref:glycosyltransferase family 10 domain-containing protein n=1 Tax=Rhodoplanes sp. SY1 TaxID=3166646 RepID=UPI0038B6A60A